MNIEAYDKDSLRKIVRMLERENKSLKEKLDKANIPYESINPFEENLEKAEDHDPDQGARIINPPFITEKMAVCFGEEKMFMLKEERKVDIFHNAIIARIRVFVPSSRVKKYFAMNVNIRNGRKLAQEK